VYKVEEIGSGCFAKGVWRAGEGVEDTVQSAEKRSFRIPEIPL
jgi:hypothetical protein